MTPTNGEADIQPRSLFPMKSGAMWVLDGDRLRKMVGRAWTAEIPAMARTAGCGLRRGRWAMHEDRDGGLWFNHYGNGLFHITPDDQGQHLTTAEGLPDVRVGAWFQSHDGGIWAGVEHGGLARLRDRRFHVVRAGNVPGPAAALRVRGSRTGLCGSARPEAACAAGRTAWSNGSRLGLQCRGQHCFRHRAPALRRWRMVERGPRAKTCINMARTARSSACRGMCTASNRC